MSIKPYQGHHCQTCWNVSLWIENDKGLYNLAKQCIADYPHSLWQAAKVMQEFTGDRTPDGFRYSHQAVMNALRPIAEEMIFKITC